MNWFFDWWNSISLLQQVFACFAIPATIILIIQTLLLMFGFGGHGADNGEFDHDISHDFDHDVDHDLDHDVDHDLDHDVAHEHDFHHDGAHHASGVRLLSIRGFVAFFAVGGWLGIAMLDSGVGVTVSSIVAFLGGSAALLLVGWILKLLYDMQENGTLDIKNAVAKTGKVYIPIPANRNGSGKVTINLQSSFAEMDAVTDCNEAIKTGTAVQVVSVTGENTLVVRPPTNK